LEGYSDKCKIARSGIPEPEVIFFIALV